MKSNRRARMAVVPAVVAAFALTACQDSAPSAAPPTPAAPTAESSQAPTESPSEESSEAPETTEPAETSETSEPAETSEPSETSADDSGSGAECDDSGSFSVRRGDAEPKGLSSKQSVSAEIGDGKVAVAFGAPTEDSSSGNTFFPGDGMKTVIYPVTLELESGSFYVGSYLKFSMYDDQDNTCKHDVLNRVVPGSEYLSTTSLKPGDKVTKKIAFAVPAGADLSTYVLVFSDETNGEADLAWKAN